MQGGLGSDRVQGGIGVQRRIMHFEKGEGRGGGDIQGARRPIPIVRKGAIVVIIVVRSQESAGPGSPSLPKGEAGGFCLVEGASVIRGRHRNMGDVGAAWAKAHFGLLEGLARSSP